MALAEAEHWILAGYSLPPQDVAIRSLLLRAHNAHQLKPSIEVVQYGPDQERGRYEALFPGCRYSETGVETFVSARVGPLRHKPMSQSDTEIAGEAPQSVERTRDE